MRLASNKLFGILLPMAMLLIACPVLAQEHSRDDQISDSKREPSVAAPDLPEIIPLAAELASRLATPENRLTTKSELHQEIDRSFREARIVIAFPQRDVHLDGTKPVEIRVLSEDRSTDKQ